MNRLGRCRVCAHRPPIRLFTKEGYDVARCPRCQLVFLDAEPSEQFLTAYYDEEFFHDRGGKNAFSDYEAELAGLQRTFSHHAAVLRRYCPRGSLLDVGCATGVFLQVASRHWKVAGVELSAYASRLAQENGFTVFTGTLEHAPFRAAEFDIVTLWDTIEHVADPVGTMKRIGELVRPGGIVALTTGDVGSLAARLSGRWWHLYNVPQHLSYFSRETIQVLLRQGGLDVREIVYPSVHFTLSYVVFRIVNLYHLKALRPLSTVVSSSSLGRRTVGINVRDLMLVVAQKEV